MELAVLFDNVTIWNWLSLLRISIDLPDALLLNWLRYLAVYSAQCL